MNVYILDWQGTLDTLGDPKGFIRALQHVGHKVVLWTGRGNLKHPAAAAADLYVTKGDTLKSLVLDVLYAWDIEKVFYSDDDRSYAKDAILDLQTDPDLELPIEFIDPSDLQAHLSTLAP